MFAVAATNRGRKIVIAPLDARNALSASCAVPGAEDNKYAMAKPTMIMNLEDLDLFMG